MVSVENELLQPYLEQAQRALTTALDDACSVNLSKVNTDELIRIEETLAVASQAAKEVVSIRLRRREQRAASESRTPPPPAASGPVDVVPAISQRVFDDVRGKRWRVIA